MHVYYFTYICTSAWTCRRTVNFTWALTYSTYMYTVCANSLQLKLTCDVPDNAAVTTYVYFTYVYTELHVHAFASQLFPMMSLMTRLNVLCRQIEAFVWGNSICSVNCIFLYMYIHVMFHRWACGCTCAIKLETALQETLACLWRGRGGGGECSFTRMRLLYVHVDVYTCANELETAIGLSAPPPWPFSENVVISV